MAIVTAEEILNSLQKYQPDSPDDGYLKLLEDITDSVSNSSNNWEEEVGKLRTALAEAEDRVKTVEEDWRRRYRDRFYGRKDESFAEQEAQALSAPETDVVKSTDEVAEDWN